MKKIITLLCILGIITCVSIAAFSADSYVAEVNEVAYNSLSAAILMAEDGDTVSLLKDTKDNIYIENKTGLTLDVNGHAVFGNVNIDLSEVVITDSSRGTLGQISCDEGFLLNISNSNVIIQNGKFLANNYQLINAQYSIITIAKGSYKGEIIQNNSKIEIYSGKFSSANVQPYVNEKCFFEENSDKLDKDEFPYKASTGSDQIEDADSVLDKLLDEENFTCPACKVFKEIDAKNAERGINNLYVTPLIFRVVHAMIHTIFKVVNISQNL